METDKFDYRIIYHYCKYVPSYYQIHKVYYNSDGSIKKIIDKAQEASGQSVKELMTDLGLMLWADKKPIIDFSTKKEIS